MLEAKHVTLSRGATTLLEDATFLIGRGEKVGLVGVNGAGKTTLLRALRGDLEPEGGSITRPDRIGYLGQERLADALETSRNPDIPATVRNVMLAGRDLAAIGAELHAIEAELERATTPALEAAAPASAAQRGAAPAARPFARRAAGALWRIRRSLPAGRGLRRRA